MPVKVGIAFVPETKEDQTNCGTAPFSEPPGLTETEKMSLMQGVSEYFKKYDFIKLIPSAYLDSKGSFSNLDELRILFGVDIIVLFSYDQSQFVEKGSSSILYWTLIGAYLVRGEKIDTHTMLDSAIYHIPGRKMMFRAQGISHIKGKSTPVNLKEQTRLDSLAGFQEASKNLILDLDEQLNLFKTKVKESPYEFQISYEPGYLESKGLGKGPTCTGLPKADCVLVKKSERKLCLKKNDKIFKEFKISLGINPIGPKKQKGDKRTPEGRYILDWRNDKSQFYKSIHISYPNENDIESARSRGVKPGNMIMIHGLPNYYGWASWFYRGKDWTDGCIAVTNADMDEIWECVPDGTPIEIKP